MNDWRLSRVVTIALLGIASVSFAGDSTAVRPVVISNYFSVIHPLLTLSREGATPNFKKSYVVGFPIGITVWKKPRMGVSFEITPFIKAEGKTSGVSNILFHPGISFRLRKKFMLTERVAFETAGRYGFTTILAYVIKKFDNESFFLAVPVPVRFGNGQVPSIGCGIQFGVTF